jgi:hypothetical protein
MAAAMGLSLSLHPEMIPFPQIVAKAKPAKEMRAFRMGSGMFCESVEKWSGTCQDSPGLASALAISAKRKT